MRIRPHFRRGVAARGARPATPGLFGTGGMSGVSAFATQRTPSPAAAGRLMTPLRDVHRCREVVPSGIAPLFEV